MLSSHKRMKLRWLSWPQNRNKAKYKKMTKTTIILRPRNWKIQIDIAVPALHV